MHQFIKCKTISELASSAGISVGDGEEKIEEMPAKTQHVSTVLHIINLPTLPSLGISIHNVCDKTWPLR